MKSPSILILLLFLGHVTFAQLTLETAREKTVTKYHLGASTYFDAFIGHAGYGAVVVLTADGGAAAFGSGDEGTVLVKLSKTGAELFKKKIIPKGDEMEPQGVAEDKNGNLYVFMLVYDEAKYSGGNERVVCFNKTGTLLFDKYIGNFSPVNNPTVSLIRTSTDGTLLLRGHVAPAKAAAGKDPEYHFWEASINSKGVVIAKVGDIIDWSKPEWQEKLKPEN